MEWSSGFDRVFPRRLWQALILGLLLLNTVQGRAADRIDAALLARFWARNEPGAAICVHRQVGHAGPFIYGYGQCVLYARQGQVAVIQSGEAYPFRVTLDGDQVKLEAPRDGYPPEDLRRLFPTLIRWRLFNSWSLFSDQRSVSRQSRLQAERLLGVPVHQP